MLPEKRLASKRDLQSVVQQTAEHLRSVDWRRCCTGWERVHVEPAARPLSLGSHVVRLTFRN